MKTKETETKWKSCLGAARQLIGSMICLGALSLICSSAPAQNLFVSVNDAGGGKILEFSPDGVQSTFASGLMGAGALAFDSAGNLFVADVSVDSNGMTSGTIYKFTPAGVRSTFALGLTNPLGMAFDKVGNLFVTDDGIILKFTPEGVRTTFAYGLSTCSGLAFDSAGNLFVSAGFDAVTQGVAKIYEFTPEGMRTIFASGYTGPWSLAFDNASNIWVADVGDIDGLGTAIYKVTAPGKKSTFLSWPHDQIALNGGLAFDSAGNLFVTDYFGGILKFTPSGVRSTFAAIAGAYELAFQPTPTPTPTATPSVSLKASSANVNKGGTVTFTATASATDSFETMVVNFSTSGNAGNGTDYTLSANQIIIPAGQSSGSVILQVITTKTKGKEKATVTLQPGTGYSIVTENKANSAKVLIHNQ